MKLPHRQKKPCMKRALFVYDTDVSVTIKGMQKEKFSRFPSFFIRFVKCLAEQYEPSSWAMGSAAAAKVTSNPAYVKFVPFCFGPQKVLMFRGSIRSVSSWRRVPSISLPLVALLCCNAKKKFWLVEKSEKPEKLNLYDNTAKSGSEKNSPSLTAVSMLFISFYWYQWYIELRCAVSTTLRMLPKSWEL